MISARIVLLSLLFGGVAGCAQVGTQPVDLATPTATAPSIPSPTEAVEATLPRCPRDGRPTPARDNAATPSATQQTWTAPARRLHSWILTYTATEPSGPVPNFVYISVIPGDFQSGRQGVIYNYDPAETETLLNMQVGESRSFREDPT